MPVLGAVYNIFINKDLLSKAGVLDTWNKSYADMMEAAKKTRRRCLRLLGAHTCRRLRLLGLAPLRPQCRRRSPQRGLDGSGLAGAEEAMQFLIDMHKAGVTPPAGSMGTQEQFDLFKAGKIAICHGETPQISNSSPIRPASVGRRLRAAGHPRGRP